MLLYVPYNVDALECQASLAAMDMEELTVFAFSISDECPDIYGFYLTPTNNDHIMVSNNPQGWSGGGDEHEFVILITGSDPVHSGSVSGEFVVNLIGPDSHELNWSIADENLMPVYWDKIVIKV
ncbi:MAG: hypothetical protein HMLIMOIP_000489 [Candidatus Nitrosomirales archaeon]|jgi:hypothetical protein